MTKRQILKEIQHCAEMESYFHAKVIRTPIEDCEDDLKIELHYNKKLQELVETAGKMGIPEKEIDEATFMGRDDACEVIVEADDNGWWD